MIKISIIVPIYNGEKYLSRCIKSLLNQTLKEIEIILVNDGSIDGSLEICEKYAKKDSRIVVIDKSNGGVSSARNYGVAKAKGDYIGFVDVDDWIESEMYNNMYKKILDTNTDVCMSNYIIEGKKRYSPIRFDFSDSKFDKSEIRMKIIPNMLAPEDLDSGGTFIHGSVCRLLIRKKIVDYHNLTFNEKLKMMEDLVYVIELMLSINNVSFDHNEYYHYMINFDSATRNFEKNALVKREQVSREIHRILNNKNVLEEYLERLEIRHAYISIDLVSRIFHSESQVSFKNKMKELKVICNDKRLKEILIKTEIKEYTTRKKIIIKAILNENFYILYVYYTLFNIYKKHAF